MTAPDFIIAGAPRTGTTWLTLAAERHPKICLAQPLQPEPKFFLVDEIYALGVDEYRRRFFSHCPEGSVRGEKSTNYLESSIAAGRIAADLPAVKLIFVLRDPVERALSNYFWSKMNGLETEEIETAFSLEEERERTLPDKLRYARPHAYFSRGAYARLLRPWLALFPREQVLILLHEQIPSAPRQVLTSFHRFIGVAERPNDADDVGIVRPSKREEAVPESLRRKLRDRYRESNAELGALLGRELPW
jgi:hypothetical protein